MSALDNHLSYLVKFLKKRSRRSFSGAKESRTPDLLRARQMLYQLSYCPRFSKKEYGLGWT